MPKSRDHAKKKEHIYYNKGQKSQDLPGGRGKNKLLVASKILVMMWKTANSAALARLLLGKYQGSVSAKVLISETPFV